MVFERTVVGAGKTSDCRLEPTSRLDVERLAAVAAYPRAFAQHSMPPQGPQGVSIRQRRRIIKKLHSTRFGLGNILGNSTPVVIARNSG
jgi:hypothetical protein